MSESIKNQAVKGVAWSAVERFSVQGIQFVLGIFITRLIAPSEYGLIAMLSIFIALSNVFVNSGFSYALIQKKDRSEVDFSTVFYFNIVVSLLAYLVLYFCAPLIAAFYEQEQLISVLRWVGLGVIISAFSIVQQSKLTVEIDFRTQAKASLVAALVSGMGAVFLAYRGYGVWVLVFQTLANNFITTSLMWYYAKWRPLWVFSWESFRGLFSFGSKLLASGFLQTLYANLYSLVICKFYSASDVGYYNRAATLGPFPAINLSIVITRAIYPLQCRMQDEPQVLSRSFEQYLRMSCYVIFPLMIGLAVLAKPLVLLLLTEKWLAAAPLISIISLAYVTQPIQAINCQILNVMGRSDYFLRAEVIKKVVAIALLVVALPFGVEMLCWSIALYDVADVIIIIYYSRRVISTGYYAQFRSLFPVLLLGVVMGGVVFFVSSCFEGSLVWQLVLGFLSGVVSYVLMSWVFRFGEFRELLSIVGFRKDK